MINLEKQIDEIMNSIKRKISNSSFVNETINMMRKDDNEENAQIPVLVNIFNTRISKFQELIGNPAAEDFKNVICTPSINLCLHGSIKPGNCGGVRMRLRTNFCRVRF